MAVPGHRRNLNVSMTSNIRAIILYVVTFASCYFLSVDAVAVVETKVPHRTSDDVFLDPCKAAAFWGDIALSDSEYRSIKKMMSKKLSKESRNMDVDKDSRFELQVEDPGIHSSMGMSGKSREEHERQLVIDKRVLRKVLRTKLSELKSPCHGRKRDCRQRRTMLRAELKKSRIKYRQNKAQLKRLRSEKRHSRAMSRNAMLAMKHSARINNGSSKTVKIGLKKNLYSKQSRLVKQDRIKANKKRFNKKALRSDRATGKGKGKSRHRRAATARKDRLWDYGVIPFKIEANFSGANKALFKLAMQHWENHTCITFKDKEPQDQHYILFTERSCGCCSFVGRRGNGAQAISIGKNCDKFGIVVHELGHVIGFWHEHTRPDRDAHVQIIYQNIMPGQEYNFNKLTSADVNSLAETYDFGSIMHYARNTFARNTYLDTILPQSNPEVVVRPEIGQRVKLSPGDIRQANKLYKCPSCGRTLQDSSSEFSHSPTNRKPELCQWRISATHGEKIVLNITKLDIPSSYNCEKDYLEVRDGYYIKSPLLGRFCGDQIPDTLISSDTRMWIEYRTRYGEGNGFAAAYEAICGGEINKDEGFLTSPNYPEDYRADKICVWKISVDPEFTVALKFQTFEIENHDDCVYDYLEVRDGPAEASPLIGNYCGYKIPEDIKSTGPHLYVKFVSDGSVQKGGFAATFVKEYNECDNDEHGCDHVCVNTLGSYKCTCRIGYELHSDGKRCEDACGGFIEQENGTITSPSYPDLYPPNKNCVWEISAPPDHKIYINFTHFDLEGHNQDCEYDSVRISSGKKGEEFQLHRVFCGYTFPVPVTSESNVLRIEFNSDNSVQKTGFLAVFTTDKDECAIDNGACQHICKNTVGSYHCACHNGFTLHDDMHGCKEGGCQFEIESHYGVVTSPNYPEYYPSRKDCVWHFSTVSGHRIRLKFRAFELEPHQECTYDHVVVFDGDDSSARSLGKFCGALVPDPVISSSNTMFMLFFSDASVQRKGFEAEHDTVCGARLVASTSPQEFVSHARYGDGHYGNRENCEWKIQAKEGHRIQFRFTDLDLEHEGDCRYDKVTVFDGLQDSDPVIGHYCGSEVPDPILSSTEYLLVRFRSDDTINWKGFKATYSLVAAAPDYVEGKDVYDIDMADIEDFEE